MAQKAHLQLPFSGEWFVLNGGDKLSINHHHQNRAQKYAFDFTKIDNRGHGFKNEGKDNQDYYAFGQPILAPGDGVVIEAVDGVRDNTPGRGNYLAAAGNHIIIQHGPDEYSFIAHLKQGSASVKMGQRVTTGQPLGMCGNSGVSFAPHLHYHLQDSLLLDQYKVTYTDNDLRKAPFPKLEIVEYTAQGIKVRFANVAGHSRPYSPVQGDLVTPTE